MVAEGPCNRQAHAGSGEEDLSLRGSKQLNQLAVIQADYFCPRVARIHEVPTSNSRLNRRQSCSRRFVHTQVFNGILQLNPLRRKHMFTELMPLLRKRRLLLTVSLVEGDTIRATVVPQKVSETEDNALTTPLAITGTAEELDRDLPQQLVEFTGAHLQLQTTLASAKAEMEAAAKAAREEARKKSAKPSSVTSPTTPATPAATPVPREPEAPSLFAPQVQPEATAAEEEEGGEAS